jgi:uncharacterized Ntn-hydrolase superfamily protein
MLTHNPSVRIIFIMAALMICHRTANSQDTFSIVAIDSVTGECGSAGASCVGSSITYPHGAAILSDVIPGVGVIHSQAAWNPVNQQNAHDWMVLGLSPQQIIDSLVANDANNNPTTRQYGIVDYNGGHPRSASYTGVNCMNYKNSTAILNYSVQGNILLGQQILDSMQSRFLNTQGTLAERLMAALQGAKVIGADTRCAVRNTSSQSAFLRVARMNDPHDSLYLDLWMAYPQNLTGVFPVDPIDSLQTLFDIWNTSVSADDKTAIIPPTIIVYTDDDGYTVFDFSRCKDYLNQKLIIFDMTGRSIMETAVSDRILRIDLKSIANPQILGYRLITGNQKVIGSGKFLK